ncbi:NAAT family transporter [Simkania negevensis]|uniref:UPF0056 membrane protein n=1 Tax=Simkania negevensis TaxID=83561 RepID=A0ABS3APV0_9BACT|nr:NAAT family transporter [Simkania negevensis]
MDNLLQHAVLVFFGFFAIMNPIANTTIFIALTAGESKATQRAIAMRATIFTFCLILIFCLLGKLIFELFGISMAAFRITGGGLVFLIGFHMLQGSPSKVQSSTKDDQKSAKEAKLGVAISPLATPIMAGPGTIATAMNYTAKESLAQSIVTIIIFAILCLITLVFFLFGQRIVQVIGECAINVITRLMGLLLAVIGMQMALEGIRAAKIF